MAVRSDLVGMAAYGGMHVEQRAVGVENVSRKMHDDSFAARQGQAQAQIAIRMPLASINLGHAG
ncbi:hypothetical protein [Mesorhizobium robiniae]|uniref:hypothetical protein n=1 Tax=Mesorhizobium robiniae TaxID=559315 RepID=UPI0033993CC7